MIQQSLCDNCRITGLALLPTRYSIVPASLKPTIPAGLSGKKFTDVPIHPLYFSYALRALRSGYFYLFYEKGPRGANYWEVFSVGDDGSLYKQASEYTAQPAPETQSCSRMTHRRQRLHYICIEFPEKCGHVYLAFAEAKWSPDTLQAYATQPKLRAERMQLLDVPSWLSGGAQPDPHFAGLHATAASAESLKQVLEYSPGALQHDYTRTNLRRVAYVNDPGKPQQLGKHYAEALAQVSSEFGFYSRIDNKDPGVMVDKTLSDMKESSRIGTTEKAYRPVLFSLWDSVGATCELNGYRNAIMGKVAQYQKEQGEWIDTYQSIISLKDLLTDARMEKIDAGHKANRTLVGNYIPAEQMPEFLRKMRADAAVQPEPRRSQTQELANDYEWLSKNELLTMKRYHDFGGASAGLPEPQRSQKLGELRQAARKQLDTREQSRLRDQSREHDSAKSDWPRYAARLDHDVFDRYQRNIEAFHEEADRLAEDYTVALVKWLKTPLFVATLNDYHSNNIADGILFNDVVGDVVFGIGSSPSGAKTIDEWALHIAPADPSNLLWRALRLNQEEARQDMDKIVALARSRRDKIFDEKSAATLAVELKVATKLADVYKKAASFLDNVQKVDDKGYVKWTRHTMLGMDKLVTSVGDRLYRVFGIDKAGDFIGQRIIQHSFMLRATVSPEASIRLLRAQGAYQRTCNAQLVELWKKTKDKIDLKNLPQTEQRKLLNAAWDEVKEDKKASALRDTRLALVVGIFEYGNILRCVHNLTEGALEGKPVDWKTASSLAASALALTAVMFDVSANGVKAVYGMMGNQILAGVGDELASTRLLNHAFKDMGEKTLAYQKLKFTGGMLGVMGSMISLGWDITDTKKKMNTGQTKMALLYGAKSILSAVSIADSSFLAMSYAPALVENMAARVVTRATAKVATNLIRRWVAWRLLGIGLGCWLTIGTIVITITIEYLDDTALQKWVDRSRFGTRHLKEPFKDAKEESEELAKALCLDA